MVSPSDDVEARTQKAWTTDLPEPKHIFDRGVRDGNPVLVCRACDKVWWPDQTAKQQGACRAE